VRGYGKARPDLHPECREQLPDFAFLRWIWLYPRVQLPPILERLRAYDGAKTIVILRSDPEVEEYLATIAAGRTDQDVPVAMHDRVRIWPCRRVRCARRLLTYVAGKGMLAPWSPPEHLVVVGLYQYSRNPMYLAVLIMLVGWAIAYASTTLWI